MKQRKSRNRKINDGRDNKPPTAAISKPKKDNAYHGDNVNDAEDALEAVRRINLQRQERLRQLRERRRQEREQQEREQQEREQQERQQQERNCTLL